MTFEVVDNRMLIYMYDSATDFRRIDIDLNDKVIKFTRNNISMGQINFS